ncbi:MAG: restriction endonuclease subunit S [Burkholderiales bacterium]
MAAEWHNATRGEFVTLQRGHDLTDAERRSGTIPVMGAAGQNGFHDKAIAQGPGIVLGRSGASFGQVHYCATDFWPHNTGMYVTDFQGNNSRFAYYFLKALDFSRYNSGSAQPSLNRNFIYPIEVRIPPIGEQRAIAHILGTLDDKIELNRRMNETLEAMARALFKSWFVDFDPVHAKAQGHNPGLPKQIADLFPDSLQDSELGKIPKGWKVGKLGDVADHPRRTIEAKKIDFDMPYIALEHMPRRSIALTDWGIAEGLESNKFEFKKGEILFGKLRPYFHKVGVAPLGGVCSTDIVVIAPKSESWFGLTLAHLSSDVFVEYTSAASTGTKMPRTNWNDMARYQIVIPPQLIAEAFSKQLLLTVNKIITGIHESRNLAALRDTLLPKLISGELRLKNKLNTTEL